MTDPPWRVRAREGVATLVPATPASPSISEDMKSLIARGPVIVGTAVRRLEEACDMPGTSSQDRLTKVVAAKALIDLGLKLCPIEANIAPPGAVTILISPTPHAAAALAEENANPTA